MKYSKGVITISWDHERAFKLSLHLIFTFFQLEMLT